MMDELRDAPEGYTYPGDGVHAAFYCDRCGSIVGDTTTHDEWHERVVTRWSL